LILIFIEPPFVVPDENKHYINICRISHGGIFPDVENGMIGSYITAEERDFLAIFEGTFVNNGNRYDFHSAAAHSQRVPDPTMVFYPTTDATINQTPYLLPAFAIILVRFLIGSLNAFNAYLVAKFANLIFYAVIVRWALIRTKAFRHVMFFLALMPMSIFQAASASYDACLIASAFLLFAFLTKILLSDDTVKICKEDIVAICLASVFLVGVKFAYAPILVLLFAIPIAKFGNLKKYFLCIGLVGGMAVLFYLVPTIVNGVLSANVETVLTDAQIAHKAYVREHFFILPKVIWKTTTYYHHYWVESFFGILGWLDTNFPRFFIGLLSLVLGIAVFTDASSVKGIRWNARLLSWAGVTVFFVCSISAMYISWNPILMGTVGGEIAYGAQGRYFIPIALFVFLIVANPLLCRCKIKKPIEGFCEKTVTVASLISLILTALLVFIRYWI
jgi:uncharacterized membrane protein